MLLDTVDFFLFEVLVVTPVAGSVSLEGFRPATRVFSPVGSVPVNRKYARLYHWIRLVHSIVNFCLG